MSQIVIIVAGGRGMRYGADVPKQFLLCAGVPVLARAMREFECDELILALPRDQFDTWHELCKRHNVPQHHLVEGGDTRFHSVLNALRAAHISDGDVVAIHDGVRPLVTKAMIERVFAAAKEHGGAIPAVPVPYSDSLRLKNDDGTSRPVDRKMLYAVQTPQAFNAMQLLEAYNAEYCEAFTDDATVYEAAGHTVTLVEGDPENIKITHPGDIAKAEAMIND